MNERKGYHTRRRDWHPNQRQRRVLDALVENRTNPEIADLLGITLDGAKWHVGELLALTGLSDRRELAEWWAHEGRDDRSALAALLTSRWAALAGALAVVAIAASFVLLHHDSRHPSLAGTDPPAALAVDLAPMPTQRPTPTPPPYPAAYYACPVTLPNGNAPPHHTMSQSSHGDGILWTYLAPDGRFIFRGAGFGLQAEGSIYVKWVWWASTPGGQFTFDAKRLDGPGSVSNGSFVPASDGTGTPGWVGGPTFSDPGCWQITARLGDDSLMLVAFLQVLQ